MQGTTTLTALDVDTPLAQTRTLILSLRPSIAWRIGMATAPVDLLDDNDDVQDVFANFDMPDEVLQAAADD